MINSINKSITLKGKSKKEYVFSIYTFDDFSDLKTAWKAIPALYLFMHYDEIKNWCDFIYFGETGNLSLRFDNHHKESCIKRSLANCIGIYTNVSTNEEERKQREEDILEVYKFPCNDVNN